MDLFSKSLKPIKFPIYKLPKGTLQRRGPLIIFIYKDTYNERLLDDLSIDSPLLGVRLLRSTSEIKRLKFKMKTIHKLEGMIKEGSGNYIDYYGNLFTYNKLKYVKVIYHKIKKIKFEGLKSIFFVENIHCPFVVNGLFDAEYVGLIEHNKGYFLIDISKEYNPPKNMKI